MCQGSWEESALSDKVVDPKVGELLWLLFAIFSCSPCVHVVSLFASLLGGVSYTVCVLFVGASTLFKRSRVGAGGVYLGL